MFTYNVGDRAFVILTAGNLATSQAVYHQIEKDLENSNNETNLNLCEDIEAVADYLGKLSIEQQSKNHDPTEQIDQSTILLGSHFIIGGQIMGQEPNLVMVYPEGNFIYVADETPFIQIGETKYGKPILDRMILPNTPLGDSARAALLSFDSTMKSDLLLGRQLISLFLKKIKLI